MRGMLIGLFYASQAIFVSLIGLLLGIIVAAFKQQGAQEKLLGNLSCGSWYLSISIGIGIIGFIVYIVAAIRYSKRERGGHIINEQTVLEEYYEPKDDNLKITKKIKLCC
jgi:heme/copper-type cytochrome/quinol oxidase subunit 2